MQCFRMLTYVVTQMAFYIVLSNVKNKTYNAI